MKPEQLFSLHSGGRQAYSLQLIKTKVYFVKGKKALILEKAVKPFEICLTS
jgi:hypothetical protein